MNVLICDSDGPSRFVLKRILTQNLGWGFVETTEELEALEALSHERFDLLLLELDLPNFDGFEILEVLRASTKLRDLPVGVVSHERRRSAILRLKEHRAPPRRRAIPPLKAPASIPSFSVRRACYGALVTGRRRARRLRPTRGDNARSARAWLRPCLCSSPRTSRPARRA